jgi:ubiquinone/menaquinone biosynthesis C-methylase UbiE
VAEGYWTYKILIDPLTTGLRNEIKRLIEPGASVLDIACGTGSLLTELSPVIQSGTGIDLNDGKIKLATRLAQQKGLSNISFRSADATNLRGLFENKFDYAILSLAVHQFPEPLRSGILDEASRITDKLIIADYTVPVPANFSGFLSKMIESIADEDHYQAYKSYIRSYGLEGIIQKNGYGIERSAIKGFGVFTIALLSV